MSGNQNIPQTTGSATILVVDDELPVLNLCKTMLEGSGFTVLQADGSSDALRICAEHKGPIDLLLTDLILPPPGFHIASGSNPFPHVNGLELAVRAATIRKGLHVILTSGNPDKELASHGIKRGTLPFLAKPFEQERLIRLVQDVLAQPASLLDISGQAKAVNDDEWFG
ncbi:MAG: response regulator [Nitrospira sp.]|nr:response regulator [Nitrospira sp.]